MEGIMLKGRNVINIFFLILFFENCVAIAQYTPSSIGEKEYAVLNDFYGKSPRITKKFKIYRSTNFGKGWVNYFKEENANLLTKNRSSLGSYIEDEELHVILNNSVKSRIRDGIFNLTNFKLNKSKFNTVTFSNKFNGSNNSPVLFLSKPIIVDEIAVFRCIENFSGVIYILQKKGIKWELIYTIEEWMIFVD